MYDGYKLCITNAIIRFKINHILYYSRLQSGNLFEILSRTNALSKNSITDICKFYDKFCILD